MKRKFLNENVEVVATDLRALLHWANYGVSRAVGGSYESEIRYIIESYAEYLGMHIELKDFAENVKKTSTSVSRKKKRKTKPKIKAVKPIFALPT